MLQNLHIKNLALIQEIEVDFRSGLNILTGETGAGKSIILGSIHLALGGRYTKDMLRKGADFGLVELSFEIDNANIEKELKALDIFPEEGRILLSRKLMDGRSISKINGETVNMKALKDVASLLIDIHGQHDHESLLHKKNHLAILDNFAGEQIEVAKQSVANGYEVYQQSKSRLSESRMDEAAKQREVSLLEYEIREIEDAKLIIGEDEQLEEQYRRMVNGQKLVKGIGEAYRYTSEADGASEKLSRAIRALSDTADYDERGSELYQQLAEVDSLLNDFNRELSEYEKSLEFSEEEFYEVEERLNTINRLKTKYGNSISEILDYYEQQCKRLEELSDYDAYIAELEKEVSAAESYLKEQSDLLGSRRRKSAVPFVKKIKQSLIELNFLEVQFDMHFTELDHYTANGTENAEFYISTNPGEELKPLAFVASGGELSRIMLAIKTVLADKEDTPTLIFDEIDTGISGITAGKVAGQMGIIGRNHQVICITHLPQIAAMADAHFVIEKKVVQKKTQTQITLLGQEQSEQELARILGGETVSDSILQSAKEMKEMAMRVKSASVK